MIAYFIILTAVASRFIPHMANAAPITAIAIFGGAQLSKKQAVALTLAARFISDLFLGFYTWPLMAAVYASHLVGVLFGLWISGTQTFSSRWMKIVCSALGSSAVFFLVTNFAFLYSNYPHTWPGLLQAYVNGLPFLRGTMVGDLGYTVALFGAYELALRFVPSLQKQNA